MKTIDPPKKNIIAAHREDADNEIFQQIVAEYQTAETEARLAEMSQNAKIKAWTAEDEPVADFEALLESKK